MAQRFFRGRAMTWMDGCGRVYGCYGGWRNSKRGQGEALVRHTSAVTDRGMDSHTHAHMVGGSRGCHAGEWANDLCVCVCVLLFDEMVYGCLSIARGVWDSNKTGRR